MKKNIFILLIVLCILVISKLVLFAGETKYDFRKTNWGMSKEQVKASEKGEIVVENENTVIFMVPDFDDNFQCGYDFLENKLYSSLYRFSGEHSNKNLYIDDYERLKGALTKKYGKPIADNIEWKNNIYKDDRANWGMAISLGYLMYFSMWETPATWISLILSGDNYDIGFGILYQSKELRKWAEEIKEKETSKGL
jgi:hypothetical protein